MASDEHQGNSSSPGARLAQFRWRPGQSGNPNGRPVGARTDPLLRAKRLARESLTEALATAVAIMRGSNDDDIRLKAAAFVYKLAEDAKAAQPSEQASARVVDVTPLVRQLSSEALARIVAGETTPPGGTADRYSRPARGERSDSQTEASPEIEANDLNPDSSSENGTPDEF